MIAKISTGSDPKGLAAYLHGPGKATPHSYRNEAGRLIVGGKVICGTVPVTEKNQLRWGRDFERAAKSNVRVKKSVWHCSLRCAPGDRTLTDAEFSDIAQTVAERMGFENHPWVAVRHDEDHIHIAVSRVDFEGSTWKNSHDRWKVVEVMREVEQQHRLIQVASPERARGRQISTGEQRKAERTGKVPQRDGLREIVLAARDISAGQGMEAFEAVVARNPFKATVEFRRNVASTGRMNGYSFRMAGYNDAEGKPIWLPASKLSRDLSWSKLKKDLDGDVPDRRIPESELPKKRLERTAQFEERRQVAGQEQFEKTRWLQAHQAVSAIAGQVRAEPGTTTKWKQVQSALTSQDAEAQREAEFAAAIRVATSRTRSVSEMLEAQQLRRKPWTPEMKREYAKAKAQAERAAQAKDAAKWTEVTGGGFRRDVRGVNLRMWVSSDGAWSLTSKKDLERQYGAGQAQTVAQAQAAAAAAAKSRVAAMWKATPATARTEEVEMTVRRAVADLNPVKPAEVKHPQHRTSEQAEHPQLPDTSRPRDNELEL